MILRNKRVLVVGGGLSGLAALNLLRQSGAQVTLVDRRRVPHVPKGIRTKFGSLLFSTENFDLIVVSPGISWRHPSLVKARSKGIPIWPELELGWRAVKPYKTVAVTGTNGKTTTTSLIGWILKKANKPVLIGGNIGTPLSALAGRVTKKTILVLEVSSYQLEAHQTFHPDIALLMNITPDHLGRHKTMENYAAAKARLFEKMTRDDLAVLNRRDAWCRRIAKKIPASIQWFPETRLRRLTAALSLPGEHNQENAMAAVAAARFLGVSNNVIKRALRTFPGVKHRLQDVRLHRGIRYINDSKATNVDSTLVALKACVRPIHLILGGEHKGAPYTPLKALIKKKVKKIFTIGEASTLIKRDLGRFVPIVSCQTLDKAVKEASVHAVKGDIVLLSPACASFDQYKNYEQRGDHFISLVKALS